MFVNDVKLLTIEFRFFGQTQYVLSELYSLVNYDLFQIRKNNKP